MFECIKKPKSIELDLTKLSNLYIKNNIATPVYEINKTDRFHTQRALLFGLINQWTKIHSPENLPKWNALKANCYQFYDSTSLQKLFKESIEAIYLLFYSDDIPKEKKIEALNRIKVSEFEVCAPGIYTHLQDLIYFLKNVDEFYLDVKCIIDQLTLRFIQVQKESLLSDAWAEEESREIILDVHEIYFANGFRNFIAEQYSLETIEDLFVIDINENLLIEFNKYIEEFFLHDLIEYLVDKRIIFIKSNTKFYKNSEGLNDLNKAIEYWFDSETATLLRENILDPNADSGSYYRDTFQDNDSSSYPCCR